MKFNIYSIKIDKRKKIVFILFFSVVFIDCIETIKNNLMIIKFKQLKKYTNKKNSDNLKVCLCVICKEENLYIKEFIEIYRKLGFDQIFIYDNNDKSGEKLEEVIMDDVIKGFVKIFNLRGFREPTRGPQMYAYFDCYKRNNLIYDWIAFFDVDEFLILDKVQNIKKFLINPRYDYCEMIKINWKIFTDNNEIDYDNKSIVERFTKSTKKSLEDNTVFKVIIRGNLSNYSSRKLYNPHEIFTSNQSCDSNGNIRLENHIKPPEYKYARLNHYRKTIKEFCKKMKRGDVFFNKILDEEFLKYNFQVFFQANKKTKKKLSIFNKVFNTSFQ